MYLIEHEADPEGLGPLVKLVKLVGQAHAAMAQVADDQDRPVNEQVGVEICELILSIPIPIRER